ncbi:MAG: restriction endonuclease subunit S [Oscillospiraceae bacterium]|nr:restriction endonuclease subunit S [Oscillospiraceae bacterium]
MKQVPLKKMAKVDISNVDKKSKVGETEVVLCNFVDVYHNWAVTKALVPKLMIATANEAQIERFSLHKGQVAITKDSETRDDIGIPTYIADDIENGVLGYHCALITPDESILRGEYLNIVLHSPYAQKYFEANASGSGQRYTLTNEIIENFPVPLPDDISIQDDFGRLCSDIDSKISNSTAICSDLEAMVELLYDYWFVQFDFPDENGKPYKSSGGKMVWNDELKREIPAEWEVKQLSEVFDITMGSSPSGESLNTDGNGIEFYQGSTDFGDLYPSIRVYTTSPVRFAKAQDVLMSVRAPVGDMNIAMNDCCIGRGLAAIHHKSTLYTWCTMLTFKPYFDVYNGNGTTFGAVTSDDLKGQIMVVPPLNVLDMFIQKVEAVGEKLKSASIEIQQLVSLRDFLLPMLMNGQVKAGA